MSRPLLVDALGTVVEIQPSGDGADAITHAVREAWHGLLVERGTATVTLRAEVDDAVPAYYEDAEHIVAPTVGHVMEALAQWITVSGVTGLAGDRLLLHACAVADSATGRCVALVGSSGAGKSTAARVLSEKLAYVTDETVAVGEHNDVLPFPKPLLLADEGSAIKRQLAPGSLGLELAAGPLTLVGMVLLDRRPEAGGPIVELVPTPEALALLAPHTSYLGRLESPLHALASAVRMTGGLMRATYAEAIDLLPLVEELLSRPRSESGSAAVGDRPQGLEHVVDWYDADGAAVVMVDDRVLALSDLATRTALLLGEGRSISQVTAALVEEFGTPPGDPEQSTREVADSLRAAGVIGG